MPSVLHRPARPLRRTTPAMRRTTAAQPVDHPDRGPRPERGGGRRTRYNLPPITVYDVQISVADTYQHMIPENH